MWNHWDTTQVLGAGILVWIWNNLGITDGRVVLAGNILAAAIVAFFCFVK